MKGNSISSPVDSNCVFSLDDISSADIGRWYQLEKRSRSGYRKLDVAESIPHNRNGCSELNRDARKLLLR